MIVLAHRGWWTNPAERNSEAALRRAFEAGLGVETDLRDHQGQVVVSHDPPTGGGHVTLEQLLSWYGDAGQPGRLALNIKADGLHAQVAAALKAHDIHRAFLFDMAVPDAIAAVKQGLPCFTRQSEYEREPSFLPLADGVWMDAFETDWIEQGKIRRWLIAGLEVALVSPELHGRPPQAAWRTWTELLRSRAGQEVMLCTDQPREAMAAFGAPPAGRDRRI